MEGEAAAGDEAGVAAGEEVVAFLAEGVAEDGGDVVERAFVVLVLQAGGGEGVEEGAALGDPAVAEGAQRGRRPGLIAEVPGDEEEFVGAFAVMAVAQRRAALAHAPPLVLIAEGGEHEEVIGAGDVRIAKPAAGNQVRDGAHEALGEVVPVAVAGGHALVEDAQGVAGDLGIAGVAGPLPHERVGADHANRFGEEEEAPVAEGLERGRVVERGERPGGEICGEGRGEFDLEEEGQGQGSVGARDGREEPVHRPRRPRERAAAGEDDVGAGAVGIDEGAQVVAVAAGKGGVGRAEVVGVERLERAVGVEVAKENQRPGAVGGGQRRAALGHKRKVGDALHALGSAGGEGGGDFLRERAPGGITGGMNQGGSREERRGAIDSAGQQIDGRVAGSVHDSGTTEKRLLA